MIERKRIKLKTAQQFMELAAIMSEGNPGAIGVLVELHRLLGESRAFNVIMHFEDMNIRGSQIWVAFKDFAHADLKTMVEAAERRDIRLVEAVNYGSGIAETAVMQGAAVSRAF